MVSCFNVDFKSCKCVSIGIYYVDVGVVQFLRNLFCSVTHMLLLYCG